MTATLHLAPVSNLDTENLHKQLVLQTAVKTLAAVHGICSAVQKDQVQSKMCHLFDVTSPRGIALKYCRKPIKT